MSRVLFSVWFRIQRIVKNVKGIIQRLVQYSAYYKKYPGDYSASGSGFSALLKCPGFYSASDSGFSVLLNMSRVLFSVWFRIQSMIKNVHDIIQRLVQDSEFD